MQRTLNRELKELEVVGREALATCVEWPPGRGLSFVGDSLVVRRSPLRKGDLSCLIPPSLSKVVQLASVRQWGVTPPPLVHSRHRRPLAGGGHRMVCEHWGAGVWAIHWTDE